MEPRMERYLTVLSMLVLAALAVCILGLQQEATITGRAGSVPSAETESVFDDMDTKLHDTETFKEDYSEHEELINSMVESAEEAGSKHPFISVAQMYYESNYFKENAIRCEKHYEKRWLNVRDACEDGQCSNHQWSSTYSLCQQVDGACDKEVYCNNCGEYGCNSCHFSGGGRTFHRIACSYGLGQITYRTALDLGYEGTARDLARRDELNMKYSVKLFNDLYQEFAQEGSTQPLVDAIMAYNTGKGEIHRAKQQRGDSFSEYVNALQRPSHRVRYVASIFIYSEAFKDLYEGNDMQEWSEYIDRAQKDFATRGTLPSSTSLPQYTASARPQVSVTLPYTFQDYERLKEGAERLTSSCTGTNLRQCIGAMTGSLSTKNLSWHYGVECMQAGVAAGLANLSHSLRRCAQARSPVDGPCECDIPTSFTRDYHAVDDRAGIVMHGNAESVHVAGVNISEPLSFENGQLADNAVLINDNGTLRAAQSAGSECYMPSRSHFRFCVNRSPRLQIQEDGRKERRPVMYRFALAFDPIGHTPPAAGIAHSTQDGEQLVTFENPLTSSDSSDTLVTKMAGVEP